MQAAENKGKEVRKRCKERGKEDNGHREGLCAGEGGLTGSPVRYAHEQAVDHSDVIAEE